MKDDKQEEIENIFTEIPNFSPEQNIHTLTNKSGEKFIGEKYHRPDIHGKEFIFLQLSIISGRCGNISINERILLFVHEVLRIYYHAHFFIIFFRLLTFGRLWYPSKIYIENEPSEHNYRGNGDLFILTHQSFSFCFSVSSLFLGPGFHFYLCLFISFIAWSKLHFLAIFTLCLLMSEEMNNLFFLQHNHWRMIKKDNLLKKETPCARSQRFFIML